MTPFRFLHAIVFSMIALIFLTSCNMSYETAKTMEPYKSLSPADSQWLFEHHQTNLGALSWLEDEIHFKDGGFRIWLTSDKTFEMESLNNSKTFKIKTSKAVSMVKKMGGEKAAADILILAYEKVGGTPQPGVEMFAPGLSEDVRKAQRLRYPLLVPRYINLMIQDSMKQLEFSLRVATANKSGADTVNAVSTDTDFHETLESSVRHLGEFHLRSYELLQMYLKYTNTPFPEYEKFVKDLNLDPNRLTRSSQVIETTEKMIKTAEAQWNEGKRDESLATLKNAHELSKLHFVENHPQVLKIQSLGYSITNAPKS